MKIAILFLSLLPESLVPSSANDFHHSELKVIEVDPTCTSADGSCVTKNVIKELANNTTTSAAKEENMEVCNDYNHKCPTWAADGECKANPIWMLDTCRLSCKVCSLPEKGYTPEELEQGVDLGVAQIENNSQFRVTKEQLTEKLGEARKHIRSDSVKNVSEHLKDVCKNENEMCAAWAIHGECQKDHARYMQRSCAPVCETCENWTCEDTDDRCSEWAADGECKANPIWMLDTCRLSCKACSKAYTTKELEKGVDLGVAQVLQNSQFRVTKEQLVEKLGKARKHIHSDGVNFVSEQLKDLCKNENEMCAAWAVHGECQKDHAQYMQRSCAPVCETCDTWTCEDTDDRCSEWAADGECEANSIWMLDSCRLSCKACSPPEKVYTPEDLEHGIDLGVAQIIQNSQFRVTKEQLTEKLGKARKYIHSDRVKNISNDLKDICKNENEMCTTWAIHGECQKAHSQYMQTKCAPVCETCEMLTIEGRCPIDPEAPEAWGPGDLDKLFVKLTSEPYLSEYNVQVVSSPFDEEGGPWLITMDNVVKEEEAERLIELGAVEGYERSHAVGKLLPDGTYEKDFLSWRTSTNAWCGGPCYEDELAQRVVHRLSDITGINETNSEFLQLLRYEEGQWYDTHHDYIPHHIDRQQGVRILTFYMYLNDVEEGGGTHFDQVKDITVTPKRGRAVLWPNVMNDDPNVKDGRTTHQATPVVKGIKYGANAWFHLRDFKTPNANNCA